MVEFSRNIYHTLFLLYIEIFNLKIGKANLHLIFQCVNTHSCIVDIPILLSCICGRQGAVLHILSESCGICFHVCRRRMSNRYLARHFRFLKWFRHIRYFKGMIVTRRVPARHWMPAHSTGDTTPCKERAGTDMNKRSNSCSTSNLFLEDFWS